MEDRQKFKVVKTRILNFEKCFEKDIVKNSNIQIFQIFRIDYFSNGSLFFSNDYNLGKIKTNLLI
jgi:hypothetical protein